MGSYIVENPKIRHGYGMAGGEGGVYSKKKNKVRLRFFLLKML